MSYKDTMQQSNNFWQKKHGRVVEAGLSRAQLRSVFSETVRDFCVQLMLLSCRTNSPPPKKKGILYGVQHSCLETSPLQYRRHYTLGTRQLF